MYTTPPDLEEFRARVREAGDEATVMDLLERARWLDWAYRNLDWPLLGRSQSRRESGKKFRESYDSGAYLEEYVLVQSPLLPPRLLFSAEATGKLSVLATNVHLSADGATPLVDRVLVHLETGSEEAFRGGSVHALTQLYKMGLVQGTQVRDRLLALAERVSKGGEQALRTFAHYILPVFLLDPSLEGAHLLHLVEEVFLPLEDAEELQPLLHHARADLSVWRALAKQADRWENSGRRQVAAEILLQIPEVRTDSTIRRILTRPDFLQDPNLEVRRLLCLDAGEATAPLFRSLAEHSLADAGKLLLDPDLEVHRLAREDLLPFLTAPQSEVRLAAIAAQAQVAGVSRPVREPPEERAARRGRWRESVKRVSDDLPF